MQQQDSHCRIGNVTIKGSGLTFRVHDGFVGEGGRVRDMTFHVLQSLDSNKRFNNIEPVAGFFGIAYASGVVDINWAVEDGSVVNSRLLSMCMYDLADDFRRVGVYELTPTDPGLHNSFDIEDLDEDEDATDTT